MAYQVTARKWRPQRFVEVVGQEHITTTLTNALQSGRVAQCYLFCGPRGVGKTTTARILAKALNCAQRKGEADPCGACPSCRAITEGTSMDVLEIDGASNNSVDDVRELREVVRYIPTEGSHKIYIVDEVHMLSAAAFNAFLKTLEEPPPRVVFVFATTEIQAVPETILSRCQRFNFRRIPTAQIAGHLEKITVEEGIAADQEALYLLARRADGALRDAESLLDQVVSFDNHVTTAAVRDVLGLVDRAVYFDAMQAITSGDGGRLLDLLGAVIDEGGDIEEFIRGFVEHASHLLYTRVQGSAARLEVADAERTRFEEAAAPLAEEDLLRVVQALMDLEADLKRSVQPRFRAELALIRLAHMGRAVDVGRLLQRLSALEAAVAGGPDTGRHPAPARATPAPRREPEAGPPAASGPPTSGPPTDSEDPGPSAPRPTREGRAAPAAPTAVAAAPGGGRSSGEGGDLAVVRDQWPRIADEVRKTQPAAGNSLQAVTRLDLEGAVLVLYFGEGSRFIMGQVGKAQEAVAAAVARVTGQQVRVRCRLDDGGQGGDGGPEPPAIPGDPVATAVAPTATGDPVDPKVRSVLDAFDGELV